MEFSIDFEGGTRISYPLRTDATVEDIRATVTEAGFTVEEVQIVIADEGRSVQIRTEALPETTTSSERHLVAVRIGVVEPVGIGLGRVVEPHHRPGRGTRDRGGGSAPGAPGGAGRPGRGRRRRRQRRGHRAHLGRRGSPARRCISLVIALASIAAYISLRFEWTMAVGALVALVHDVVITGGVYALAAREVTPETIIAILTILGFSLYDTVVIYDKIQENTESPAMVARLGYDGVVDLSLNQTIMRSVNTSLVVLLPILSLLLFGGRR